MNGINNLEKSVESRQSTQAIGAASKSEKPLITSKATSFSDSLCTPISYASLSRSTDFSRIKRTQLGLTLIELLITLGVMSILMSVAVPGFQSFTVRNNSIAQANDLIVDLQFARNEAAKIGSATRVCVGNSTGCRPGWGTTWQRGWAVVVNATGAVLRVHPAIESSDALTSLDGVTLSSAVDFNRYGFSTPRIFKLCDQLNQARAVLLSRTGRIRLATDTDSPSNGLVDDESNNDISCP